MFRRLANLLSRREPESQTNLKASTLPISNPISLTLNQSLAPSRDALARFMRLITAHLDAVEGRRLIGVVLTIFDECENPAVAFEEGVLGEKGQRRGQWFAIQCDWKASEELEWQVSEIAASFVLEDRWEWGHTTSEAPRSVPLGLCEAARWASSRGLETLHLDLGSDAYYSVMVRRTDADTAFQAAADAGLKALRTPEFEEINVQLAEPTRRLLRT
jgi:hypothetical protein